MRIHDRSRAHRLGDGPGLRPSHERPRPPNRGGLLPSLTPASATVSGGGEPPPAAGLAEVRVIAAHPDTARLVAQVLRRYFSSDEPRSYPAGDDGSGTLLHFTVDTGRDDASPPLPGPWLASSRTQARRSHADEPG
jgi:hypothetical protein